MESFEMRALQDGSRVVEKLADFAGSVILQLLQKQGYVEKQGIKALLDHIRGGGGTLTTVVSEQRAEDFKELMKKGHIPYVEIEHVDPQTKERSIFFVYRDCDQAGVKDVLKQFEISLDQRCNEVDLDTFTAMTDKKPYGTVYGLTKAEVYAFREAAKEYNFFYSVVADGDRYAVVGSDTKSLRDVIADMSYNLSGGRGKEYEASLQNYFKLQEDFTERMKPEPGRVKYLVNAKNPANFISVDEQGITTHSVGRRPERGADGVVRDVIYDCRHVTYPGYDKEKLKQLALELRNPIILTEEDFTLVKGLSKTKEAILSQDYVQQHKDFVEAMKHRNPDFSRIPRRKPMYVREDLVGLTNLPMGVVNALVQMEIPEVYVDGCDVAYPKELQEQMNSFLEERLYQGMTAEEKAELKQTFEGREENRAMDYMLQIENDERRVLKSGSELSPELLNEVQKEAVKRMKEKEIREQTMSKEVAKALRERMMDRRMEQEVER